MVAFDEAFMMTLLIASAVPLLPVMAFLLIMKRVGVTTWTQAWTWFAAGAVAFGITLYFTLRWVFKQMTRYRNDRLGYLGEREVAEHLRPLLAKGYDVYHDVPAQGTKKPFNLDHVAVGPAGVTVIEVKTVRKGKARAGYKDYVVSFDGTQLVWPWAENRHGLDQALSEAEWLQRFLFERLGLYTQVKAVLALPGWWVETVARGPVIVVNAKNIAAAVEGKGTRILSDKEIDLISRQLDTLCRDVED